MHAQVIEILNKRIEKLESDLNNSRGYIERTVLHIIIDNLKEVKSEYVRENDNNR